MPGAFITFTYPSTRVLFLSEVRGACQRQGCLISKMRGQCPPPTLRRWRHDWMAKKGIVRSALHRPCVGGGTTGWLKRVIVRSALHRPCVAGGTTGCAIREVADRAFKMRLRFTGWSTVLFEPPAGPAWLCAAASYRASRCCRQTQP